MPAERSCIVIIPARLASTRFPEKMLAVRTGRPLVQHVVEAAARCPIVSMVAVAADDRRIVEALAPFGTRAVLTGEHPNGTSRLAEAAKLLGCGEDQVIVNVQGDEPEIEPGVIAAAAGALRGPEGDRDVGTVATPMGKGEDAANPNIVKAVVGVDGRALYFSRARVPWDRDGRGAMAAAKPLRHVGIYAYRRRFLDRYVTLPPTPLEQTEMLEQLRMLEHGCTIGVSVVAGAGHAGIDTPEQYEAFVSRWQSRRI